jgi:hypothetical protein
VGGHIGAEDGVDDTPVGEGGEGGNKKGKGILEDSCDLIRGRGATCKVVTRKGNL